MTEDRHRHRLEAQLHAAQDLYEKHARSVSEILELLAKADARRKAEPEALRRWDQVLDHLEESLVQARARVSASRHQLTVVRRALQEALGAEALRAAEASHESAHTVAGGASFEARLEKVIGAENAAAALNDDRVSSSALAGDPKATPDAPATGLQNLQSAINKIQAHRVHALEPEEIKATIAAYDRLARLPSPNLKDQRLMRILSAAVKIFQRNTRRKK